MKAENLLLLGGIGIAAYLIYQSASSAATVGTNLFSSMSDAAQSAVNAVESGVQSVGTAVQSGVQAVESAPAMWNCGDASAAAAMPFGTGALTVPDSYVIPCMGGVTAGMIRASGASNSELIQDIAAAECACAAAKAPNSGVSVQNNVIVPTGMSGTGTVPYGLQHRYYARQRPGWPPGQFPQGHA